MCKIKKSNKINANQTKACVYIHAYEHIQYFVHSIQLASDCCSLNVFILYIYIYMYIYIYKSQMTCTHLNCLPPMEELPHDVILRRVVPLPAILAGALAHLT